MDIINLPTGKEVSIYCSGQAYSRDCIKYYSDCIAFWMLHCAPVALSRVALLVDPGMVQQVITLSLHRVGITVVPLAKSLPIERIKKIIHDLNIDLVLVDELFLLSHSLFLNIHNVFQQAIDENKMLLEFPKINSSSICIILHTSGTTGKPKSIGLTYSNIFSLIENYTQTELLGHSSLSNRICSFDFSIIETLPYLILGRPLHIVDQKTRNDPKQLAQEIIRSPAEAVAMTPSFFYEVARQMLKLVDTVVPSVPKKIIFGGEKIAYHQLTAWREIFETQHGYQLFNIYGPTECTVFVTYHRITENDFVSSSAKIGQTFGKNIIHIVDENGQVIQQDNQKGEIVICGESVSPGYISDVEHDNFQLKDGMPCYFTGDIGYVDDGVFFIDGRKDNQVKVRGFRVDLDEISQKIFNSQRVKDCYTGIFHHHETTHIVAYIVCSSPDAIEKIYRYLAEHLPEYAIPNHMISVPSLPTNANGKIDQSILKGLYQDAIDDTNTVLVANRIKSRSYPMHFCLTDLHLTSLETVELCLELEKIYQIQPQTLKNTDRLSAIADQCESAPRLERSLDRGVSLNSSFALPSQGYYLANYFKHHLYRDSVSVSLHLSLHHSEREIKTAILKLIESAPELRFIIEKVNDDFLLSTNDTPIVLDEFQCSHSSTGILEKDFDFSQGRLFYFSLAPHPEKGYQVNFHFAHVMVDGFACKTLLDRFAGFLQGMNEFDHVHAHEYSALIQQKLIQNQETYRHYWSQRASIKPAEKIFGTIPYRINSAYIDGKIKKIRLNTIKKEDLNRILSDTNISLHTLIAFIVSRVSQSLSPQSAIEFHSPISNRNHSNRYLISNVINIIPFYIPLSENLEIKKQLVQFHQCIQTHIEHYQLSWDTISSLTQRDRIGLIVAESPKLYTHHSSGIHQLQFDVNVIAKNPISFFYSSYENYLDIDIRYNLFSVDELHVEYLSDLLKREIENVIFDVSKKYLRTI